MGAPCLAIFETWVPRTHAQIALIPFLDNRDKCGTPFFIETWRKNRTFIQSSIDTRVLLLSHESLKCKEHA